MNSCKQCDKSFEIFPEDRVFYEKIGVPPPVFCPECRRLQLMCLRNERTFYQSTCAECKEQMVSCFSPNSKFRVFCTKCWWSEKFNPLDYGRDFDFKRPFFDQFWEYMLATPVGNLFIASSENSDYSNYAVGNKNCYMATASDYNEDSFYADNSNNNRDVCDVSFVNKSELIYEGTDLNNSYNCAFSQNLKNCNFCFFCEDLIGCANCIGCIGLQNAQYRIFNQQLSKEEYEKKVKELPLSSSKNCEWVSAQFKKFKLNYPKKFSYNINAENSIGNYIVNSKNCINCFDMQECDACRYSVFGYKAKDSYDVYGGPSTELGYHIAGAVESYNIQFCALVWPGSLNVYYSFLTRTAKNCLGCVSLHDNEYCIFNKQYSKEEYEALFAKIKAHMMETGEWGNLFPLKYAPWAYNETVANDFYPKTKEEVLKLGAKWNDKLPGTYGKETLATNKIPDDVKNAPESITDEILACDNASCGRNYRLIKQELDFHKKLGLALPRKCPTCRYLSRVKLRNPRELFERKCMNPGCTNSFKTTFAPGRPEKIFCEECYLKR